MAAEPEAPSAAPKVQRTAPSAPRSPGEADDQPPPARLNTVGDVCQFLGVEPAGFVHLVRKSPYTERYRHFTIPKRSGGLREIRAPHPTLRDAQRRLADYFATRHRSHPAAHGFLTARSIVSNAKPHENKRLVLNLDLKDFFPSINFGRVRGLFLSPAFAMGPEAATFCAQICTFRNSLPQGAPSSPILSNFIAATLDRKLQRLARQSGATYTRYADDITFSTNRNAFPANVVVFNGAGDTLGPPSIGAALLRAVESSGFEINHAKVRLQRRHQRQSVTGLTVNAAVNVDRRRIRRIRAMLHAWEKFGLDAAAAEHWRRHLPRRKRPAATRQDRYFRNKLYGELAYMRMVRGADNPQFLAFCSQILQLDPAPATSLRRSVFGAERYDVFISHASEDKEAIARPIAEACARLGLSAFLDAEGIAAGDSFTARINVALGAAPVVLAIISERSAHKDWPLLEINTALAFEANGEKTVMPLIVGDPDLTKLPLIRHKSALFWEADATPVAEALQRACAEV